MIQIPSEITNENPNFQMDFPNVISVLLPTQKSLKCHTILQSMHCIEIIQKGTVTILRDGKSHTLQAGQIDFRKKGMYQAFPSEDYCSLILFIGNEFISQFLKTYITLSIFDPHSQIVESSFSFSSSEFIDATVHELTNHVKNPQRFTCCVIKFGIQQILLHIVARDPSKHFVEFLCRLIDERKIDIGYFMEANFTKQLTIAEMAKQTARSISVFKKEFVNKFQQTPMKWQVNRRLEYANYLIINSHEPISSIAYNCGFTYLSHFSKAYKLKFGYAPSKTHTANENIAA